MRRRPGAPTTPCCPRAGAPGYAAPRLQHRHWTRLTSPSCLLDIVEGQDPLAIWHTTHATENARRRRDPPPAACAAAVNHRGTGRVRPTCSAAVVRSSRATAARAPGNPCPPARRLELAEAMKPACTAPHWLMASTGHGNGGSFTVHMGFRGILFSRPEDSAAIDQATFNQVKERVAS